MGREGDRIEGREHKGSSGQIGGLSAERVDLAQ